MPQYSNIKKYQNFDFSFYREVHGLSFSDIKQRHFGITQDVNITEKIRIGSLVDKILTEDDNIDISDELFKFSLDIANRIKSEFGGLVSMFEKQVSFICDTEYQNIHLPSKGRLDFLFKDKIVVDLKVNFSCKNLSEVRNLINFMKYDCQIYHYGKMACAADLYILVYLVKARKCELVKINETSRAEAWWDNSILMYGNSINNQ